MFPLHPHHHRRPATRRVIWVLAAVLSAASAVLHAFEGAAPAGAPPGLAAPSPAAGADADAWPAIATDLRVGDVVFIRVPFRPFREVAAATGSWTNHVGIVVDVNGAEPVVAESTFPLSRTTPLSRFVARSEGGRVAVSRLDGELSAAQQQRVRGAAEQRQRVLYDTGFDLHSSRQFCSRFVREVLIDALGVSVGQVETFAELLSRRPDTGLGFWKAWFLGSIPWERDTVTPASLLASAALRPVFDGHAARGGAR